MAHAGSGLDEDTASAGRLPSASRLVEPGLGAPLVVLDLGEHTRHVPRGYLSVRVIARSHAVEPDEYPIAVE